MKTLAKTAVIFAVLVLCAVAFKIGYYEIGASRRQSRVTAEYSAFVPSTVRKSQPQTLSQTEKPTELLTLAFPERIVIYSAEESTGAPVGSTTEKPDLSDSVFVGDSVSLGFSRYCAKQGIMKETVFLTAGSYAVHYALSKSMAADKGFKHPIYKGKEMPLLKAVEEIKPKNIFFCLGINDISGFGVEGTVKNYCKLINSVWGVDPNIHIYIVSTTFMVEQAQKKNLNNLNLANLNHNMKLICLEDERLDYIDIMSGLQNEKYALDGKYCSDGFIHQGNGAYEIWAERLGAK